MASPHIVILHTPHTPAVRTHPAQEPPDTRTPRVVSATLPARCCRSDSTRSARPSLPSLATHRLHADTASSSFTPAHCQRASNPPHSPSSSCPSSDCTPASAHRHTLFGIHTDTPAPPKHPASTREHHHCYTHTHTPPAQSGCRSPVLSWSSDPASPFIYRWRR